MSGANAYTIYLEALVDAQGTARSYTQYLEALVSATSSARAYFMYVEVLCQVLVPGPYVPDANPVWNLKPDWSNGVTERLKWKTTIYQGDTGVEQGEPKRITPRRDIEARYLLYRDTRRVLENLLNGPGAALFHVPVWWEKSNLSSPVAIGAITLPLPSADLEIQAGDTVMICTSGAGVPIYELVQVQKLTDTGIALINTTANAWPAGSEVYLTKLCRLIGAQKPTRRSDDVSEVVLTFETREPNAWPAIAPSTTLNGFPVLLTREDFSADTTLEYTRLLAMLDNQTAPPAQRDAGMQAFRHREIQFKALNRAAAMSLRGMLYFMQGKLNRFYHPTGNTDVILAFNVNVGDLTIQIINQDYSEYGGPSNVGRNILGFFFGNGTPAVFLTITESTLQENGYELLTLSAASTVPITVASVRRVCFVQLYRQDVDEVEINHVTDQAGATVVKTTFISTQNQRSATDYDFSWTGYTGDAQGL